MKAEQKQRLIAALGALPTKGNAKMPGYSYGHSPRYCRQGSILRGKRGSVCEKCYCKRGNYLYPCVSNSLERKSKAIMSNIDIWKQAFIEWGNEGLVGEQYFRFNDSGDLLSEGHLKAIIDIAIAFPHVKFWLPTKEYGIVKNVLKDIECPINLTIRISSYFVDSSPPKLGQCQTSTVSSGKGSGHGMLCLATHAKDIFGKECGPCRICWDKRVDNVDYCKH